MIFALSLGESVVNHFARRCLLIINFEFREVIDKLPTTLPCLDSKIR